MSVINLDWNVVIEILIGVILYKIVDSLFNWSWRLVLKAFKKIIIRFSLKK